MKKPMNFFDRPNKRVKIETGIFTGKRFILTITDSLIDEKGQVRVGSEFFVEGERYFQIDEPVTVINKFTFLDECECIVIREVRDNEDTNN